MPKLSHFDESGAAVMVDVSGKPETSRMARASGTVSMSEAALSALRDGGGKKGDALGVARVAGIMAAKRTSELIPLCHPIPLSKASVDFRLLPERRAVEITATVSTTARTGVEMEALAAVSAAALTVYDMLKSADKGMVISGIRLLRKEGGRSGVYEAGDDTGG